eukprot:2915201-Amphidinium_carterae.1
MPRPTIEEAQQCATVPPLHLGSVETTGNREYVENSEATYTWDVSGYNFSTFEPSSYIDSTKFALGPLEHCQLRVWPRHSEEKVCVKLFIKDETRLACRLSIDGIHADAGCTKEAASGPDGLSYHMMALFPCRAGQIFSSIRVEALHAAGPSGEDSRT